MRKIFAFLVSMLVIASCTDPFDKGSTDVLPNRVIYYTSSDGERLFPKSTEPSTFGAALLSNTYNDGIGALVFDGDVKTIGGGAFSNCSGLTSITIPGSVTSIGRNAFEDCSDLTSVEIPNSVTSIGGCAFRDCSSLTSITIGNSVTSIGYDAFAYCSSLTNIIVASDNPIYDSRDNSNAIIETETNTLVFGCKKTIIPNNIAKIGKYAFYGCSGLTSIAIPNSVTSIEDYTFCECSDLVCIIIGTGVRYIGNYYSFYNCNRLNTVINFSNLTFTKGSGIAKHASKVINAPNGFFDGDYVWLENENGMTLGGYLGNATELIIPDEYKGKSVTSIGENAFADCSNLTSITIPNSVTSIEMAAFADCSGLTSITIPNSVTSIENNAFDYCRSLKELNIEDGESVLSLGGQYFSSSSSSFFGLFCDCPLETLYLGRKLSYNTNYGRSPFRDISTLTSVTISNSVTSIGDYAFFYCSGLTSIEIPNSVTNIGEQAFCSCSALASITIPNSVTSIGGSAFSGCTGLKEVHITDLDAWKGISFGYYDNPLNNGAKLYLNGVEVTDY